MSCFGDSTGPGESRTGRLSFMPTFNPGSHLVDFDQVRVVLTRPGSSAVVLDTVVTFPASADSIELTLSVPIEGSSEAFDVVMDLIDQPSGAVVFRIGPAPVTAAIALGAPQALPPFLYVGPGANATGVRFVATPGSAFFGDTVTFTAEAFDANNVAIPGTPIMWSVSDTTRATLVADSTGKVVARTTRGPVSVIASLLRTSASQNPPSVTGALAVQPRPSAISIQSGNTQTGAVGSQLAQPLTARVLAADQLGVTGVPVTFAVTAGGGSLSQQVDTTDANGDVAVTWTLGGSLGAQSVTASVAGIAGAVATFGATGSPGVGARLEFQAQPTNANENAVISPAVTVRALDQFGNVSTGFTGNVTVAILNNAGSGTLAGTVTRAAVAGVATFNDLAINNAGAGYTLLATATNLASDTSAAFTIIANQPAAIAFDVQPSNVVAGIAISPAIQVSVRNASNAVITGFTGPVTLAIGANPGSATIGGTTTVNAVAGVATFNNITLDRTGTGYTLVASIAGPVTVTSGTFDVSAGPAAILSFSTQPPASTIFDTPFITVATARDASGNVASSYTGPVTLGIGTNPSGGALYGTLTVNAVAGVATFSGIEMDNVGTGYTLTVNAAGLAGAASAPLNVVAPVNGNAWINSAGGSWSVAANWSKGTVPNATDTVFIRQTGTYTVNLDANVAVNRLIVGGRAGAQTLIVSTNQLTSAGTGIVVGTAGKMTVSGSGTLTGSGGFSVFGAFDWQGGSINASGGPGVLRLESGSSATISGIATRNIQNYDVQVGGTATWSGTHTIQSGSAGSITVLSGGTLDVTGDPTMAYVLGGAVPAVVVQAGGTLNRNSGGGDLTLGGALDNDGTVSVAAGRLVMLNGGTWNGNANAQAGSVLLFQGGTFQLNAGNVIGAGVVRVDGATVHASAGWNVTGTTVVAGGTLNANGAVMSTAALQIVGGTLGGNAGGLLGVGSSMTWSGGNLAGGGGTVRVLGSATLTISGTATRNIQNYVLELAGSGSWTGTHTMQGGSSGTLRVLSGGSLDVQGDVSLSYVLGGAAPLVHVQGALQRTTSAGIATIGGEFDNDGATSIATGTLRLPGGSGASADGSYSVSGGATLDFNNGTHTLGATSSIGGTGTVAVTGGTVNANGSWSHGGATQVAGGTLNYSAAGGSTASLAVSNGVLGGSAPGVLNVTSAMTWTGGNLAGGGGTTRVGAAGTLTISGTATRNIQNYNLEVDGAGTWSGTQTVQAGSSGTIRVRPGASLDIQGDPTLSYVLGGAIPVLHNQGTLTRSTSTGTVTIGGLFNNDGSATVSAGTLNLVGGGTLTGTTNIGASATLQINGGTHGTTAPSSLAGAGLLAVTNGTINVSGTANLGQMQVNGGTANIDGPSTSIGTLSISLGTLGGSGLVAVTGSLTWTGGSLSGAGGTVRANAGATLAISGTATRNLANYVLELGGTGTWTGTHTVQGGSAGTLRVLPAASLDIQGDPTISYVLGGAVPVFDNQGQVTRSTSTGPVAFGSLFNSSGTLAVNSGTLVVLNGGTQSGTATLGSAGILSLSGGTTTMLPNWTVTGLGTLTLGGGTLSGLGTNDTVKVSNLLLNTGTLSPGPGGVVQVTSTGFWSGSAQIVGGGTLYIPSGNTFSFLGTATRNFVSSTIDNRGTLAWSGAFTLQSGSGSVLRNNTTGVMNVTAAGIMLTNLGGAAPALENIGTLNVATGVGVQFTVNENLINTGTINVTSGTLAYDQGGSTSGPVVVSAGATVAMNTGTFSFSNGANFTGAGSVTVGGGANFTTTSTLDTARFVSLTINGGNLAHNGGMVVSGALTWNGGNLTGTGMTRLLAGGTLSMTGTATRNFTNGTLENRGTGSWSTTFTVQTGSGARFVNAAGATFTHSGNGGIINNLGGAQAQVVNEGTWSRTGAGLPSFGAFFVDTVGTSLSIGGGGLTLAGGARLGGNRAVTSLLNVTSTLSLKTGMAFTGNGLLQINSGGVLTSDSAGVLTPVLVQNVDLLAGGAISTEGVIEVSGVLNWSGGDISSNAVGVGGQLVLLDGSSANITGTATRNFTGAMTIQTDALATITYSGAGTIQTGSGAVINNTGLFNWTGDGQILYNLGGITPTFDNLSGTLRRSTSANPAVLGMSLVLVGTIQVQTGSLRLTNGSIGSFQGTATVSPGALLELAGGTFTGTGTMTVSGDVAVSAGSFDPGNKWVQTGNFATSGTGALVMNTATDSMLITGNMTFGGGTSTLTSGAIRLSGNFTQTGAGNMYSASGSHRMILDGNVAQNISFASPASNKFNVLNVQATNVRNIVLQTDVRTDTILMFGGAQPAVLTGAGTTQRLTALRHAEINMPATGAPRLAPPVLEIAGTIATGGAQAASIPAGFGHDADTTVFIGGAAQTIPVGAGFDYNNIRVGGTSTVSFGANTTVPNNLVVSSGTLSLVGRVISVTGNFRTHGTGLLQMTGANDSLKVTGNVDFSGGTTSGTLTNGVITVAGNFSQGGTAGGTSSAYTPTSAAANTVHRLVMNGAGAQTIAFGNPTISRFDVLRVVATGSRIITVSTDAETVDSLHMTAGPSAYSLQGPTARLRVGGVLRLDQQTGSPNINSVRLLELNQAPSLAGLLNTVAADTVAYINSAVATLPIGANIAYNSIRLNTNANVTMATDTITGNLEVASGTAVFSGATTFQVGGNLSTAGGGAFSQTNAGSRVTVVGSATFAGGNSTAINNGVLEVRGDFTQSTNAQAFQASGAHETNLAGGVGAARQRVSFANPGTGANSRFGQLRLGRNVSLVHQSGAVLLMTNMHAARVVDSVSGTTLDSIVANTQTQTFTTDTLQASDIVFDGARLVLGNATTGGTGSHGTSNIQFRNMITTQTFVTIHRSTGAAAGLAGFTFNTTPSGGGLYVNANMPLAGTSTIALTGSNIANGCALTSKTGAGTITLTWNGNTCP